MSKLKYFIIFLILIVFLFYKLNRLLMFSALDYHVMSTSFARKWFPTFSPAIGDHLVATDRQTDHKFRVLLWTKYFGSDVWSKLKLKDMNCNYANCGLTSDRRLLSASDAVMFHWRDIHTEDLPEYHLSGQKWILYNWESPHNTPEHKILPLVREIDWTMSYRTDSDIYSPYGYVQECDNQWHNEDLFDIKSKSVAWIVSHCNTHSKREQVARELGNYIGVDIYGYCGKYQCKWDDTCFTMIANTYKFYLSFENSLCKDYVTEKLFRTLEYDIIPVVYGSANYRQILPNNSYIDVRDFNSTEELANYLKVLSNDKDKYNSYMKWKSNYCVKQTNYQYLCDICQKLNLNKDRESNNITASMVRRNRSDLIKWWFESAHCQQLGSAVHQSPTQLVFFVVFLCCALYNRIIE